MKNDDLKRGVIAYREHSSDSLLNAVAILKDALKYQNKIKQSFVEESGGDAYIEAYVRASRLMDQIKSLETVAAELQESWKETQDDKYTCRVCGLVFNSDGNLSNLCKNCR